MNFVYPQFLFGLLALGIPIIIHLFNFRRAKRIYFSNNQFLLNIKKATSTRLKIKHYLILISRLLFIFFLVITFAQPFLPAKEKNLQSNQAIIYLDNSFSMSNYVEEDLSALEAGISFIQQILDIYPQNSQFLFLTNDFAPYSNSPKSKHEIGDLITEVSYNGTPRSIEEIIHRMESQSPEGFALDVYWISDFQVSSSGELNIFRRDTTKNFFLVPLTFTNTSNVYIDSLFLSNPFLIQGEKNNLNAILRNDGGQYIEDLLIKLSINDIQSANGSISINPYSTQQITFDLNTTLDKFNYGSISFEDFPVTFDNDFYFTLTLSDRISIVELKDSDSVTVIEKVYGNQGLFNFRSYNSDNIDYNELQSADLIILDELSGLEPTIANELADFIIAKGDLILIPPEEIQVAPFKSLAGTPETIPDSLQSNQAVDYLDISNPFFTDIFEDKETRFNMPTAKPVLRITGSNETILRFRSGEDFLSYRQGNNRVYLFSSPFKSGYTDFYNHAIFVPVMYRIAMLSKKEFNRLYYTLDETVIKIAMDSMAVESLLKLSSRSKEIIPEARVSGDELTLDIPGFELTPGHYTIESLNKPKGVVAFNPDKRESRLEQYSIENLEEISRENSYVRLFNTKGFDNFDKEIKEKYLGVPLWRITLILALIFLLIEILLIRFL